MIDNSKIEQFDKLSNPEKEEFVNAINERIKPEEEVLKKKFKLSSTQENGVILVKNGISKAIEKANYEKVKVSYIGAGEFEITISHDDMKSADRVYKTFKSELEIQSKENKCRVEIH